MNEDLECETFTNLNSQSTTNSNFSKHVEQTMSSRSIRTKKEMHALTLPVRLLCVFSLATVFLLYPFRAIADCKCHLDFNNGFDNWDGSVDTSRSVTITKIKTAKKIALNTYGTYKTQWKGSRKVYNAGHSVFSFTVDFCGGGYKARFIRKDNKQCTKSLTRCGSKSSPIYFLCSEADWR